MNYSNAYAAVALAGGIAAWVAFVAACAAHAFYFFRAGSRMGPVRRPPGPDATYWNGPRPPAPNGVRTRAWPR